MEILIFASTVVLIKRFVVWCGSGGGGGGGNSCGPSKLILIKKANHPRTFRIHLNFPRSKYKHKSRTP